jgi:hypothetical protein
MIQNSSFLNVISASASTPEGTKCIEGDEFDCADSYCIHKDLKCNNKINCQLRNDEDTCVKVGRAILFALGFESRQCIGHF